MAEDRTRRLTSIIQELAATFIQHEANTDPLITITEVRTTPDNKHVTVLFTTMPEDKEADALIFLKRNGRAFREYIKKHTRLKLIPNIDFAVDFGERHRQHIDDIVEDINKDKEN